MANRSLDCIQIRKCFFWLSILFPQTLNLESGSGTWQSQNRNRYQKNWNLDPLWYGSICQPCLAFSLNPNLIFSQKSSFPNDFEFIYGDRSLDGIQMRKNALSWLAVSLPQALNSTLKSVSYCDYINQKDFILLDTQVFHGHYNISVGRSSVKWK